MTPSETFLQLINDERLLVEEKIDVFKECFALCKSPLEQQFFVTWLELFGPNENYDPNGLTSVSSEWQVEQGWLTLLLYPQYEIQVEGHQYRVDFLLRVGLQTTQIASAFVIELDGHDFHERTKEQALRDKTRDRALTRAGFTVLRFTGREIHQGAQHVISEIQDTVMQTMLVDRKVRSNG